MVPEACVPTCTVVKACSCPVAEMVLGMLVRFTCAVPYAGTGAFLPMITAAAMAIRANAPAAYIHLRRPCGALAGRADPGLSPKRACVRSLICSCSSVCGISNLSTLDGSQRTLTVTFCNGTSQKPAFVLQSLRNE